MKLEYQGQPVQLEPEVRKYLKAIGKNLRLPKKIKQSVLSDHFFVDAFGNLQRSAHILHNFSHTQNSPVNCCGSPGIR